MVNQVVSCPPGLEAGAMGGNNLAMDAVAANAAFAHRPQLVAQDKQAPGPVLLGRGFRGGLLRNIDEKPAPQPHSQRKKASDRQRLQSDPIHGKAEPTESANIIKRPSTIAEFGNHGRKQPDVGLHLSSSGCVVSRPQTPTSALSPISPSGAAAPVNPTTGNSAAPLSLADALGLGLATHAASAAPRVSTCSGTNPSSQLIATSAEAVSSSTPAQEKDDEVDAFIFGFTIRVAGGTELGLATSSPLDPSSRKQALYLRIDSVLPGGAVEAWNRQCGSSGAPEKVLLAGDKIIRVNSTEDTEGMLKEFVTCRLLRMLIVRTPSKTCAASEQNQQKRPSPSSTGPQKLLQNCAGPKPPSPQPVSPPGIGLQLSALLQSPQFSQVSAAAQLAPKNVALAAQPQMRFEI